MSRHVLWSEAGINLRTTEWGEQAINPTELVRYMNDQRRTMCLLIDIAQSLKEIETSLRPLRCSNFQDIPNRLKKIVKNTTKGRRKKRDKKNKQRR